MKQRATLGWVLSVYLAFVGLGPGGVLGRAEEPEAQVEPEPFPFSDRYPAEVTLASQEEMDLLVRMEINIGDVRPVAGAPERDGASGRFQPSVATVYVDRDEVRRLEAEGLVARAIPNQSVRAWRLYGPGSGQPSGWPTWEQWVARMQVLAENYPGLVRMQSLGQSVLGRPLWALKVTDNPDIEEDEPEVRFWSTHHGNEPVGGEMALRLAELLTSSYGTDPDLTALVNSVELWVCPLYNPDGYVAGSRWNAHGVDLNRDFPDRITDPVDDPAGREPETQANMAFGSERRFVLGVNYHAGALVVNYVWDSVPNPPDYAPDDGLSYDLSVGYSSRNPMIWNGGFPNGVTRGWEWYVVRGGMQDWAYHWKSELHVTIEVSDQQPPPYSQMATYWNNNREAMLWWLEQSLTGVRGLVTDAVTGAALDATVEVLEVGKPVRTDSEVGDYHRLVQPGSYTLRCSAPGYLDQEWGVQVAPGTAVVQDCPLVPVAAATLHVGGIKMRYGARGSGKYVVAGSVRVVDEEHAGVPGAATAVEWTLPDGSQQAQQALTSDRGLVVFRVKTWQTGSFELCVTGVIKDGYSYDPTQNHETCESLIIP